MVTRSQARAASQFQQKLASSPKKIAGVAGVGASSSAPTRVPPKVANRSYRDVVLESARVDSPVNLD